MFRSRFFSTAGEKVAKLLAAGEDELRREKFDAAVALFSEAAEEAEHAERGERLSLTTRVQNRLGYGWAAVGEAERAKAAFRRGGEAAREAGEAEALASALVNEAAVEAGEGEEGVARALGRVREARKIREGRMAATAPAVLDVVLDEARLMAMAGEENRGLVEEALEKSEAVEEEEVAAHLKRRALGMLVESAVRGGWRLDEKRLREAEAGDEELQRMAATYLVGQKQPGEAVLLLRKMEQTMEVMTQTGMLLMASNREEEAREVLEKALREAEKQLGNTSVGLAKPLWLLAQSNVKRHPQEAQKQLLRVLELVKKQQGQEEFAARITHQLAAVSLAQGLPNQTTFYLRQALRLAEACGDAALVEAIGRDLNTPIKKKQ